MTQGLNIKEISNRIKESGKRGTVIWTRQEEAHFISNRHFLLRISDVPSEVLISLFSIFLKVPEVGETLIISFGIIEDPNKKKTQPIDYSKIYKPDDQIEQGRITSFIKEVDKKIKMRVIRFQDHFKFVDEKYMKMTTEEVAYSTRASATPIYLADGKLMLLPYRINSNTDEDEVLKDLIDVTG